MKTCTTCNNAKPLSEYHKHKNGLRTQCKSCRNAYLKQWATANPDKRRAQKYRHRYGLTVEQYNSTLKEQNDRCAICQRLNYENSEQFFLVDHNHTTGEVLGLLCRNCNTAIGLLQDDHQIVGQAAYYLRTA